MKRCSTCKRELSLDHFVKNRSTKSGLSYECRDCRRAFQSAHYKVNASKLREKSQERYRLNKDAIITRVKAYYLRNKKARDAYRLRWSAQNRDKQKQYGLRHYYNHLEWYMEYRRLYNALNSKKRRAHARVASALRAGAIMKSSVCGCCGSEGALDAHHSDYDKPLLIDWLCRSCHKQRHANEAEQRNDHFAEEARSVVD